METVLYYDTIQKIKDQDMEALTASMPDARREKLLRLKGENDRLRSLTAGLLLQKGLSKLGLSDASFGYEESGKPVLLSHPELCISISHSGDYAAVLLSDQPCGVDIQQHKGMKESLRKHILHKNEEPVTDPSEFYELFSKKEAMIKVHGFRERFSDMDTTNPPEGYRFFVLPLPGYSFVVYGAFKSSFIPSQFISESSSSSFLKRS